MSRIRSIRVLSKHHTNHSIPVTLSSSPQRLPSLASQNSPEKQIPYQFLFNQISLFSASGNKNPKISNKNAKSLTRHRSRVESLNNLMSKCNEVTTNNRSTKNISLYNKQAGNSIRRIKRSLNLNISDNKFEEISAEIMKKDAQDLSEHLTKATQNLKTGEKIWKFKSKSIPKSTEKLIDLVSQRLGSRKSLKKVFLCIK